MCKDFKVLGAALLGTGIGLFISIIFPKGFILFLISLLLIASGIFLLIGH